MRPAQVANLADCTTEDVATGAVRSVQTADVSLPDSALAQIWSPINLERLARTYWRFLSRFTLGVVRVHYTEAERFVILLASPLKLLTFKAPEYEMGADHGIVRWRIERGLLVAKRGKGSGYLQILVRRKLDSASGAHYLHVEVEVANFYPSIASGLGRWFYKVTQSRIHVFVTHGFLRSLARLDLAESKVGKLAGS
jgi:hypothetical protein